MVVKNTSITALVGILLLGGTSAVNAASDDRVSVHGYGDTGYIKAIENNYTKKAGGNNWDFNYLSVNFTAIVDSKTKIVAQIRQGSEITGDMGAYVNYNVTDNLTARAGQMKAPVGIFNEIRDIKFLQLSALAPLMYQDAVGILTDSFKGVEAIYHIDMGTHRMTLDAYAGEPKGGNSYVLQGQAGVLVQNIYGARMTYKTPIGLKLSLSYFQDDVLTTNYATNVNQTTKQINPGIIPDSGSRKLSVASLDYRNYDFDIKLEYVNLAQFQNSPNEVNGKAYYGQIGYTFAEKFTPYARYDYALYDKTQEDNPIAYQLAKVLGITYRLNNNISLRMENHWNHGYAIPLNSQGYSSFIAAVPTPVLDWNVFAMGANFIF